MLLVVPSSQTFSHDKQKTQPMDTLAHFYSFMYYTVQHKNKKKEEDYSASASCLSSG